jgi:3'-phosphoadenosine 5'-phosphosulfate (PAPS) 3'-phosphatase
VGLSLYFDETFTRFIERHIRATSSRSICIAQVLGDRENRKAASEESDDVGTTEADAHLQKFISEQLEKVKIGDPLGDLEDEIEA